MTASDAAIQLVVTQRRAARLRNALMTVSAFFTTVRQADPLPMLRDLCSEWLQADNVEIMVPAGTGSLQSHAPTKLVGPITIGRRVIGRIEVTRSTPPFDSDDRELLTVLGQIIGIVFEQSSLQSQLDQYLNQARAHADTLDQLLQFGRLVTSATTDPLHLGLQLATQVPAMVGGERASLLLIQPDNPESSILLLSNGHVSTPERAHEVREHGFAGLVLREGQPLIIDETDADQRWLALRMHEFDSPTRCAMAAPLRWGSHLLGALTVTTTHSRRFDSSHLNLLELVACHISLAIYAADLEMRRKQSVKLLSEIETTMKTALAAARAGDLHALDTLEAQLDRLHKVQQSLALDMNKVSDE
ncbi:GAF domain-containing protein [Chloroflexus aggregans]|uniref:Phytochrome sensor protein n=1 Tax=Chloroflexus aggregans (strain MD-66 / DSM 9485) TaxID=326427 RepID=B8GBB6_CHLAD|nr:GAF domain-containing protein [Chloroflexus aggregans]ACL24744.1 putative phytochrome sensor protein [Chloroflexus aggregans DSM 9485]